MRMITAQYGKLLLAAVIGAAVLGMCLTFVLTGDGPKSFASVTTEQIDSIKNFEMQKNRTAFKEFANVKKPEVSYCYENGGFCTLTAKESVKIADCIQAVDSEGNRLVPKIQEIRDQNGKDCMEALDEETQALLFAKAGVYTCIVCAKDNLSKTSVASVVIPVEEARRYP